MLDCSFIQIKDNEIFKYFHLLKRSRVEVGSTKSRIQDSGWTNPIWLTLLTKIDFYQSYMNEENRWGLNTYVCEAPLCKFKKEEVLVLSFTIRGGCLVKLQMGGFQEVQELQDEFKSHLDAESWTVVHKQHSDMCSEHPISWNTNRARAIWRTGDQFEKCEQFKYISQYEATALLPEMLKKTPGRKQRDM